MWSNNQFVIFYVITFPLAAFILFLDLSHKKAWIKTITITTCLNKNGNMSDTSNYRPVAVATVVSKLLEHFILSSISPFLGTTDNQFGFKAGYSTDQCKFLLKQTASYFVAHGSSVHAVFRCFESIRSISTHEIIWETSWKKGANVICAPTKTLFWYKEQTMQIKWGKHFSEPLCLMGLDKGEY